MLRKIILFILSIFTMPVFAGNSLNTSNGWDMMPGVTELSNQIFDLHRLIFLVCLVIAIGVFGAMGYSIYAHRKSKGYKAASFHENTKLEILWTVVPLLILVAISVPATQVLIDREDVSQSDINIKVTGSQWKWSYDYIDSYAKGIGFISALDEFSQNDFINSVGKEEGATGAVPSYEFYLANVDNRLVIPTGKRIRFLITSKDVLHSWWVPDFGVKLDAIPGFINAAWAEVPVGKEGVYRGACTELCGRNHAFMPVVVEAMSQAGFEAWAREQREGEKQLLQKARKTWKKSDLIAKGKQVYTVNCSACHGRTGTGIAGLFPSIVGSAIVTGSKAQHMSIVLNGKGLMPAFLDQLSDVEIAAVLTYQRSSLNNVGDSIQPKDIKKVR